MMPPPTQPHDHRAHARVPIGYRVKVVTDDQMITYASALNVSLGGLLLQSTPALPLGRACGVAIFLLDREIGRRLVARGIVVRSDLLGTAIRFTSPLDAQNRALMTLLVDSSATEDAPKEGDIGAAG